MRVLTINELMRLTRAALCSLAAKIAAEMPTYREGSPQRTAAYISLRNVRFILARRNLSLSPRNALPAAAGRAHASSGLVANGLQARDHFLASHTFHIRKANRMQAESPLDFRGYLVAKSGVREWRVFIDDAVLLEHIGGNSLKLALFLRFMVMPEDGFKAFIRSPELVGIVRAVEPREVDVDLIGDGVRPSCWLKRIRDERNARIWRAARLGQDDLPAYDVVERKMRHDAAGLVAAHINQVEELTETALPFLAMGQVARIQMRAGQIESLVAFHDETPSVRVRRRSDFVVADERRPQH